MRRRKQLVATVEKAKGDDWKMTLRTADGTIAAWAEGAPGFVIDVQCVALKHGKRGLRALMAGECPDD